MFIRNLLAVAAALAFGSAAHAGVVLGGSTLVNGVGLSQLEGWLGKGELTLTNIFTKTAGSNAQKFHLAADGKGATFVLMNVSIDNGAHWETIGGYNPLSWSSVSSYNYVANLADRSAFIFNLTDGVKAAQRADAQGAYQTYNTSGYGPAFGGGHDIYVDSTLSTGYSNGYSYGNVAAAVSYFGSSSIVDQTRQNTYFTVGAMEVFKVAGFTGQQGNVPEPASLALVGLALFAALGAGKSSARRRV